MGSGSIRYTLLLSKVKITHLFQDALALFSANSSLLTMREAFENNLTKTAQCFQRTGETYLVGSKQHKNKQKNPVQHSDCSVQCFFNYSQIYLVSTGSQYKTFL